MDAGSFVIALLTAAGAAAGPTPGALPDDGGPSVRCIAAPGDDGSAGGLGARDRSAGAGADDRALLVEETARDLAELVAGSDDPTDRRLAAALLAAGFEPGAGSVLDGTQEDGVRRDDGLAENAVDRGAGDDGLTGARSEQGGAGEEPLADRLGPGGRDDGLDQDLRDRRDDNRLADDTGGRAASDDRLGQDRVDRAPGGGRDEGSVCADAGAERDRTGRDTGQDTGSADRRTDLDDVLARSGAGRGADSDPDSADIAAALEREQGVG